MEERQEFPLKVVVYGCLVDELLTAYGNGERKFCDRDLPSGLAKGDRLQHRIIITQVIPRDDQPVRSLGFAATEHYLLPILGSKKSEEATSDIYEYGHRLHARCEETAAERSETIERLEVYFEIDEDNQVVLAGSKLEDCSMIRTRPVKL